jgi:selenide,water dikinase
MASVHALTDVTGFALVGHLSEMCLASGTGARIDTAALRLLPGLRGYLEAGAIPGGTKRNQESYRALLAQCPAPWDAVVHDPQTSGGLLVAVDPKGTPEIKDLFCEHGLEAHLEPIGVLTELAPGKPPLFIF